MRNACTNSSITDDEHENDEVIDADLNDDVDTDENENQNDSDCDDGLTDLSKISKL